jgi:hypothetical protein
MFKKLLSKMIEVFIYGFGFVFFSSIIVGVFFLGSGQINLYQIKTKLQKEGLICG